MEEGEMLRQILTLAGTWSTAAKRRKYTSKEANYITLKELAEIVTDDPAYGIITDRELLVRVLKEHYHLSYEQRRAVIDILDYYVPAGTQEGNLVYRLALFTNQVGECLYYDHVVYSKHRLLIKRYLI